MDSIAEVITEEAAKEFPEMSNPDKLSDEDVNRIAEAVVEKAAEDVGVRDIMIGSAMGSGAIPLYGRETRKEPCACCLIDPAGPNAPENRMCTTKGAIGLLNNREEREWCSEISIVPDGRCARARAIGEAARECKEKHPDDTTKFFECYIPAFSQITRGSNPTIDLRGDYDEIAQVKDGILYRKGNIVQVWWDKWGKETWTGPSEEQAKENFNAMKERWSSTGTIDLTKGRMIEIPLGPTGTAIPPEEGNPGEPRSKYYYCGNAHLHPNNEVLQIKTLQDNPKCPYCGAIMTYGRYWGPLLATQKEM